MTHDSAMGTMQEVRLPRRRRTRLRRLGSGRVHRLPLRLRFANRLVPRFVPRFVSIFTPRLGRRLRRLLLDVDAARLRVLLDEELRRRRDQPVLRPFTA
jgi:hypothetical protein